MEKKLLALYTYRNLAIANTVYLTVLAMVILANGFTPSVVCLIVAWFPLNALTAFVVYHGYKLATADLRHRMKNR